MDRAPRPCPAPGCPNLTSTAYPCKVHAAKGRAGPYDKTWEKVRLKWLQRHPLCAFCGRVATEVNHVKMIRAGGDRLKGSNLQSLCGPCHRRLTVRETRPAAPRRFR